MDLKQLIADKTARLNELNGESDADNPDAGDSAAEQAMAAGDAVVSGSKSTPAQEPDKRPEADETDPKAATAEAQGGSAGDAPADSPEVKDDDARTEDEKIAAVAIEEDLAMAGAVKELERVRARNRKLDAEVEASREPMKKLERENAAFRNQLLRSGVDLEDLGKTPDLSDPKLFEKLKDALGDEDLANTLVRSMTAAQPDVLPDTADVADADTQKERKRAVAEAEAAMSKRPLLSRWYWEHMEREERGEDVSNTPYQKAREIDRGMKYEKGVALVDRLKKVEDLVKAEAGQTEDEPQKQTRKQIEKRAGAVAPSNGAPNNPTPESLAAEVLGVGGRSEQRKYMSDLRKKDPAKYAQAREELSAKSKRAA